VLSIEEVAAADILGCSKAIHLRTNGESSKEKAVRIIWKRKGTKTLAQKIGVPLYRLRQVFQKSACMYIYEGYGKHGTDMQKVSELAPKVCVVFYQLRYCKRKHVDQFGDNKRKT